MDINELLASFAGRHGIENLAVEDGSTALEVDGMAVAIAADGDSLVLSVEVGLPPAEGHAAFADLLLEANLRSDAVFAKDQESGTYVILRRLETSALDDEAFDAALEALVNMAETWRRLLDDFRPAAKEAEESAGGTADLPFGAGGFIQV